MSVDATRSKGGNGRKTPAMVDEWTLPARADVPQRTTGKAIVGYDESTSTRIQNGTSDKVDLFQNADGSITRRVYASPMNFRGADGLWRPIDTTLRRSTDGRLRNSAGETAVVFAGARPASFGGGVTASESAGSGELSGADTASRLVSVTLPTGQSLEYGLVGAAPVEPEVAGSVATYADILPGTDVELVALGVGVKETLILKSPQVATQWVFPLTLNGLTARLQPDGSVALLDVSGKAVSMIPHGWMRDSRVDGAGEGATSNAVTYELISVGGKPALRMSADAGWVRDPARVFPIHLDPGVFPLADGSTYVQKNVTSPSSCCTNNNSGMPELKVGYHSSGPWRTRSFLKFDSVSALAGYRVWSANVKVNVAWSGACPSTNVWSGMWAYDITSPWDPETVTNWSNQPSLGVEMASGGAYPDSTVCNNNPTNYNAGQWWLLPFGPAGAEVLNRWTTGGANHGLAILADESSNDNNSWKKLSSVYTSRAPLSGDQLQPEPRASGGGDVSAARLHLADRDS